MAATQDEHATTTKVPAVPEVLTEEHHEAIKASWELPAYERQVPVAPAKSHRALYAGLLAGALCLAAGLGAGYWAHIQTVEPVTPIVVTRQPGPVDANGAPLGRRVAPLETQAPTEVLLGMVPLPGESGGRP